MYRARSRSAAVVESLEHRRFLSAAFALRDGLTAHLWAGSVSFDGSTYFEGNDAAHGFELWRTDGTAAGTRLVKDINPTVIGAQAYHSFPQSFMVFNGALLFVARDSNAGPAGLWRTDGTEAGTVKLTDAAEPDLNPDKEGWYALGGKLYGMGTEGLVVTDGTVAGTRLLAGGPGASSLAATHDRLYWLSADQSSVMSYDGTTVSVAAVAPAGAQDPALRSGFGTGVVFSYYTLEAGDWVGHEVTLAPRDRVVRPLSEQQPRNYDRNDDLVFDGVRYFSDDQNHLWRRGRTPADDVLLHEIERGSLTAARGTLFFAHGRQLWRTDGTAAGTRLVRDFGATGTPQDFAGTSTHLYFTLGEPDNTVQPWRSDGTPQGTVQFADVGPHAPEFTSVFGVAPGNGGLLVGVRDRLYLVPDSPRVRSLRPPHQNFFGIIAATHRPPSLFGTRPIGTEDARSNDLL